MTLLGTSGHRDRGKTAPVGGAKTAYIGHRPAVAFSARNTRGSKEERPAVTQPQSPVLVIATTDPESRGILERELRVRYGSEYTVVVRANYEAAERLLVDLAKQEQPKLSCQAAAVEDDGLACARRSASFHMWRMMTLASCRLWARRAARLVLRSVSRLAM